MFYLALGLLLRYEGSSDLLSLFLLDSFVLVPAIRGVRAAEPVPKDEITPIVALVVAMVKVVCQRTIHARKKNVPRTQWKW